MSALDDTISLSGIVHSNTIRNMICHKADNNNIPEKVTFHLLATNTLERANGVVDRLIGVGNLAGVGHCFPLWLLTEVEKLVHQNASSLDCD